MKNLSPAATETGFAARYRHHPPQNFMKNLAIAASETRDWLRISAPHRHPNQTASPCGNCGDCPSGFMKNLSFAASETRDWLRISAPHRHPNQTASPCGNCGDCPSGFAARYHPHPAPSSGFAARYHHHPTPSRPIRCLSILISLLFLLAAAPPPGVLRTIEVHGNQIYAAQDILKTLGLNIGDQVSVPILEQARQKVQSLDVFSTVSFQFKYSTGNPTQYDVVFTVAEDTQVLPLHFERLGADPADIRAYLKTHVDFYSDQIPGTASIVQRYRAAVQDYLTQTVKNPVRVRATVATDETGKLQVNFFPDAPIPTIALVDVTGNEAVDKGVILRAANDVAIGVPLTDARIKLILEGAIRPVYAARGYPLVTFPKVETEPSKTTSGVILKVTIHEGPKFNFGPLRFRGKGLEEDEIRAAITFKPGDPYSSDKVDAFRVELLKKMRRKGLLDATIDPETSPDEPKHIMNVVYNVVPGEPYHFQRLDIRGLDMTAQPVIEKLWGEKPGQTFNPDYPDFFLKRVAEQGLFDNLANTESDYTADPATHAVTVHLYFKGGKPPEEKKPKEHHGA